MRIGFVGAGNMAGAMARGLAGADDVQLAFADAGSGRAALLAKQVGGARRGALGELAADTEVLVLAMKPGGLDAVAAELAGAESSPPVVLSVLGGVTLAELRERFPASACVRAMPNVAVAIGQGVVAVADDGSRPEQPTLDQLDELLGRLGTVIELPERLLDAATALAGSGPAFLALVVESLVDAAVELGFDRATAHRIVLETTAGSVELLQRQGTLELRSAVTSPGGVTAAGLAAMERGGLRATLADGLRAAVAKIQD